MRLRALTLATLFLSATTLLAQAPTLPSTSEVLAQAKSQAAADHKNILLVFSASWCGPCHMFERFLEDPSIHPIIDKAFVVAHLDVGERPGDTRHANSPGAEKLMNILDDGHTGYPLIVMLDASGKPIVTSLRPTPKGPDNVGYPDLRVEVDWFMQMLQQSAPNLSPQDTATIHAWLTAHGQH